MGFKRYDRPASEYFETPIIASLMAPPRGAAMSWGEMLTRGIVARDSGYRKANEAALNQFYLAFDSKDFGVFAVDLVFSKLGERIVAAPRAAISRVETVKAKAALSVGLDIHFDSGETLEFDVHRFLRKRNGVKSTVDPCSKLIRVKSRLDPSDPPLTPCLPYRSGILWKSILGLYKAALFDHPKVSPCQVSVL